MAMIHYEGELGVFDYDDKEFEITDYYNEAYQGQHLHYIGHEPDGSRIKIPDGIKNGYLLFGGCESLKEAPAIPKGIESCSCMFFDCTSLEKPPIIPESVSDCSYMFFNCTSLKLPPVIPEGVKDCDIMFDQCISLEKPPEIPENVGNCDWMFRGCESLEKSPIFPENAQILYIDEVFEGCSKEVQIAGDWNIRHRGKDYYIDGPNNSVQNDIDEVEERE